MSYCGARGRGRALDLAGAVFSRLTVLERAPNKRSNTAWLCACTCGRRVVVRGDSLTANKTVSCGCWRKEKSVTHGATRGLTETPEYRAWCGMRKRCFSKGWLFYADYGGRGVTVCERWRADFAAFLADMGHCQPGQELDRIDTNGNYEPGNCRWTSESVQSFNRRTPRHNRSGVCGVGWKASASRWCARINVNRRCIHLGLFVAFDEAVAARRAAELRYFGFNAPAGAGEV